MKDVPIMLAGKEFRVRRYEIPLRFKGPLERLLFHLAFHAADDYINPRNWAWAVLIIDPAEAATLFLPKFYPPLTAEEISFLEATKAVIVKAGKKVEVDYFACDKEARRAFLALKRSAEAI